MPPPVGEGDEPCRQPQGYGRETPEGGRYVLCASAGEQGRSAGPRRSANGVISRSGPAPARTRCARNSMAKVRAHSAPGAGTIRRHASR